MRKETNGHLRFLESNAKFIKQQSKYLQSYYFHKRNKWLFYIPFYQMSYLWKIGLWGYKTEEIIKSLDVYNARHNPEYIILASPAFYKEDLMKEIDSGELKRKIVLATSSDVSEAALHEVTKSPELARILQNNRAREEELLVEELLKQIKKDNLAAYGFKQVKEAILAGAVETLLVTDELIHQKKLAGEYPELDELMQQIDALKGEIHVLSTEFDGGRKLQGLGGIAAILRYKMEWRK